MLIDNYIISEGKYAGMTLFTLAAVDPAYLVWCVDNIPDFPCSNRLYADCCLKLDNDAYEEWNDTLS